ncbi:MAG: hypothetical protein H8K03_02540 [Nitrospira sp.]|jgi:hypothetical protein|nr:hypothetical protein [Nitrospira sp. BO4]
MGRRIFVLRLLRSRRPIATHNAILFLLTASILLVNLSEASASSLFEQCRDKLAQARHLGLLADFEWKPPRTPKVVVGREFFRIPFEAKKELVETVNCYVVKGRRGYVNFPILEWINHRTIGEWRDGHLRIS